MTDNDSSAPGWLAQGSTDAEEVARYYDDWAEGYDKTLNAWGYEAPRRAAERLRALVALDARILDAGCGTGLTGRALAVAGFQRIDGLDISERSLRLAEATGAYQTLRAHDLNTPLPLPDDAFDALQCIGVLTYIADGGALMREFARVVRPGGTVLVTQRDDLFDARDFPAMLEELDREGLLETVEIGEPEAYLPHNEDFADRRRVRFVHCRVARKIDRRAHA